MYIVIYKRLLTPTPRNGKPIFLFIPRYGVEVGLLNGVGKPLGREHADGGTAREEGRDEVGCGAQGELKVGVLRGGA